jgi:glyoxylase-like metal-dependent hydrolase (beta-lactamase superfamily II)
MQLAPSLHRIGSDLVNVYLVGDETGVTIIDAGLPGQWDELEPELVAMGHSLVDARAVLLTHGDTDHIGFAERIRRDHGVPVFAHELDAPSARGEVKKDIKWGKVKVAPLMRFLWYSGRRGGMSITPVSEVGAVADGEVLDLPGNPIVIHIPGHTPGSVAFHFPSVDAVFVGDALTTGHVLTGAVGPQPAPFTIDPEQALASLARLEDLGVTWVLPGHGPPWDGGIAEAVRLIRDAA